MAESLKGIKVINILQEEMGRPDKDFVESEKVSIEVKVIDNQDLCLFWKKRFWFTSRTNPYVKSRIALEARASEVCRSRSWKKS